MAEIEPREMLLLCGCNGIRDGLDGGRRYGAVVFPGTRRMKLLVDSRITGLVTFVGGKQKNDESRWWWLKLIWVWTQSRRGLNWFLFNREKRWRCWLGFAVMEKLNREMGWWRIDFFYCCWFTGRELGRAGDDVKPYCWMKWSMEQRLEINRCMC